VRLEWTTLPVSTVEQALVELLVEVFDESGLRRFVASGADTAVLTAELPGSPVSMIELTQRLVAGARRHGLLTNEFFARLHAERPRHTTRIDGIRRALAEAAPLHTTGYSDPMAPMIADRSRWFSLRMRLGCLSLVVTLCFAILASAVIYTMMDSPDLLDEVAFDAPSTASPLEPKIPSSRFVEHTVEAGETWEDISNYYGVSPQLLARFNVIDLDEPVIPGTKLRVLSDKPPRPPLQDDCYLVSPGDTWRSIASYYATTEEALRKPNMTIGDQLRGGEELCFVVRNEPFAVPTPNLEDLPIFIVPEGAASVGAVTDAPLRHAVQLLPSPLCDVRCSMHAYATRDTVTALLAAITAFRAHGYTGQIMIADLSRRDGGAYGPHRSHQSGRDADIWLLSRHEKYTSGCPNCDSTACRPQPADVDWAAQWRFIRALDATGEVEEIFLSAELQRMLYAAAKQQGATPSELRRIIQYPRKPGHPALVMHSDVPAHQIHVRFKEVTVPDMNGDDRSLATGPPR